MSTLPAVYFAACLGALIAAVGVALWLWRANSRLARERATARALSESANDAVLVADVIEGRFLDANPAACEMLGRSRESLLQMRLPDLHRPAERGKSAVVIADVWEKKGLVYSDLPFVRGDGVVIDVEISAKVIEYDGRSAVLLLARDIRDRLEAERKIRAYATELEQANRDLKEMQAQLVRSEQLASLGNLAAGLAHEINNPIGSVNANVDTGRRAIGVLRSAFAGDGAASDARKVGRALDALEATCVSTAQAGERIAGIVRSLRNFARLDEAERKRVDLHDGIDSALTLLQHRLGDRIVVERRFDRQIPAVDCSPGQLNQVFMQLLLNALEAIDGQGTIAITTTLLADGRITVVVEDSGRGIAPQHLKSVFDPGFTTKGVGVGAGLGLAISYRIVEEHGGTIDVESEQGKGTTVTLRLPCAV